MIEIDGSMGEGGGQIVRSALGLSLATGQPFRVANVRGGRRKPGLLRQHLTALKAAIEVFTGFGRREATAEEVARDVLDEVRDYLAAGVPVGPHLADQLLVPLALAGGGSFATVAPTRHTTTNLDVIRRFLPLDASVERQEGGRWTIELSATTRGTTTQGTTTRGTTA